MTVAVDCPGVESSLYQNRKGFTDEKGKYNVTGHWDLQGCNVNFSHDNYRSAIVRVEKSHLVSSDGLLQTYKIDVHLEAK